MAADTAAATEDGSVVVDVLANDSDVEGDIDPASVTVVDGPANGTVTVDPATGEITYTPDADFNGTDSFTYSVCDRGAGGTVQCRTAGVTVTVGAVNDGPVARADSATVDEDGSTVVDVLANDLDVDDGLDPASVNVTDGPANGTVFVSPASGAVTYTPNPDFTGTDAFTYQVCDATGACATATVTVLVGGTRDEPVANGDAAVTAEDTPVAVDVVANDTDADGDLDPTSVTVTAGPANGTVTVNPATGAITYTPAADFNGTDTFTYSVCDAGVPALCDTATVLVTVTPVADTPGADGDTATVAEDGSVAVDVLANDFDADGDADPASVTVVSGPANGTVNVNPATGAITYTPAANFNGLDSFTYQVCDSGGRCDTATVTVTVAAVPDTPLAVADLATVAEDGTVPVDVVANDTDADSDLDPSTVTVSAGPDHGTVTVNPVTGEITYRPAGDFNGTDTFAYSVCDSSGRCSTATVTVAVGPVADAPVAADDTLAATEDTPATVDVAANDADADASDGTAGNLNPGSVRIVDAPAKGTVTVNPATGAITYTPEADANGPDRFTYEVCDTGTPALCATATVTVEIAPVDDTPDVAADTAALAEDGSVVIDVLANDSDARDGAAGGLDPTSVTIVTPPGRGVVTVDPATGAIAYTPDADFTGTDTFTYQVCDTGGLCGTATVTVNVAPLNDAPVARADAAPTDEDTAVVVDVVANDDDPDTRDAGPGAPEGGIDPATVAVTVPAANGTTAVNPATGAITYTPDADFTGRDSFSYRVCDTDGACSSTTVTVLVGSTRDAPVAAADTASVSEDGSVVVDVAANDSDPDGDLAPGSVTITEPPEHGTVTVDPATGAVTYTPDGDYNGPDAFTYQICDTAPANTAEPALCGTATVTLTVGAVADAPVAGADVATTTEDAAVVVDVAANDTDADGNLDPADVRVVDPPTLGTATVEEATGRITYTPAPDANGTDTFTYEICDAGGLCATATVTVTVVPVADAPVAADDSAATPEDGPVTVDVVANDRDADGDLDPGSVTITAPPASGTVTVNPATGAVTYTPAGDFNGTDTFTYAVCDRAADGTAGACTTATVTVNVGAVADAPVAGADTVAATEDTPLVVDVLANDTDPDSADGTGGDLDPGSVTVTDGPDHGTVTVNPDGTLTYTPAADYNGPDSFTYQVCDTGDPSLCATGTVTVGVAPVDDAPVAAADSATVAEDTPLAVDVLANDNDARDGTDGGLDPARVTIVTGPARGIVDVDPTTGVITYTPDADFNGTDSFTYQVCDTGGLCDTATVGVTVEPVNDGPVARDDATPVAEDGTVSVPVLDNDTDADSPDGTAGSADLDPATVAVTAGPTNGTTAVDTATGAITYTPAADFTGTDSFTYQVCDTAGACSSATVTVVVGSTRDVPVATADNAVTAEDTAVVIGVAGNDTDADGDLAAGTVTIVSGPANGTLVVDPSNGTVTYTPAADFTGTDTFTYQICDAGDPAFCDTATVTVDVTPVADAPVAVADTAATTEDAPITIDVAANDSDGDGDLDPATVAVISGPARGTLAVDPGTGAVTYTPNADTNGPDSFTYEICDATGRCATATVAVDVASVADAPVAADDDAATAEDTPVVIDVLANDTDADGADPAGALDPATLTVVSAPANGTVTVNPATGAVTYTPGENANGPDSFTYSVCDRSGLCSSATVTLGVTPVADPPVAGADSATVAEDGSVGIGVLGNDTDADGIDDLTPAGVTIIAGPDHGTAVVDADTGAVVYTPDPDFNGTDTFTYQVCDGAGLCDTATVAVAVTAVNDRPVAAADTATVSEDGSTTVDVLANDGDVDGPGSGTDLDPTTVRITSGPTAGTVTVDPVTGTVTYVPAADTNGSDTFTYEVCDAGGLCTTATVAVTVVAVNDSPAVADDNAAGDEDSPVVVDVLANDSDATDGPGGALDPATVVVIDGPTNGTTTVDPATGAVTYTPNAEFNGADSFTYQVCDRGGLCGTATVVVGVGPVNDVPVARDDAVPLPTPEDTAVTVDVLANDNDPEDRLDPASVVVSIPPTEGTTSVDPATGAITYTPAADFNGTDTFTYSVCDRDGACATATVTVEVGSVRDAPVTTDDTADVGEDGTVTFNPADNDGDGDGDLEPGSVSVTRPPSNGTTLVAAGGTITYRPNEDFSGTDDFTYQVCDNGGGDPEAVAYCSTGNVTVNVAGSEDVPVARADGAATAEDTPIVVDVTGNDSDADGNLDPTTVRIVVGPGSGTVSVNGATGRITYTPAPDTSGSDTFTYEVCDTTGRCATATVNVAVGAVADTPVAADDTAATGEDTPVVVDVLANDTDADAPNGADLDPASVAVTATPARGTATVDPATGRITYTPADDTSGSDTFTYTVCDRAGACSSATVAVTVTPVADIPSAVDDTAGVSEDGFVIVDVAANDTDADGDLDPTTVIVSDPAEHGTVTVDAASGQITYRPDPDFNGTDTFTYQVCDRGGRCDTATVAVTVVGVADAPVAVDDAVTATEDNPAVLNLAANDTDADDDLDPTTLRITAAPANGTVTVDPATGAATYTPDADYSGPDTFTYEVCDATGLCATGTVALTVGAVNDAPAAGDDTATVDEDNPVTVDVLANDSDARDGAAGALDPGSVTVVGDPANGQTSVDPATGAITYTPDADFTGTDSFTYQVCDTAPAGDGGPLCSTATVTVTVAPANDTPVVRDDATAVAEDTPVVVDVLANDSDVEEGLAPASVAVTAGPANGTTSVDPTTGAVTYTPDTDFTGTDTFTYTVCDNEGACASGTVTVLVGSERDVPVAGADNATVDEDGSVVVDVAANDSDADGDLAPGSVTITEDPENGTVSVDPATGAVTYTPDDDYTGPDTFTYQICDGGAPALCDTATVTLNVGAVADVPVARPDNATIAEDGAAVIDVVANDSDADGGAADGGLDPATVAVVDGPANGTASVDPASGAVTYTPAADFTGTDGFTYEVCDTTGRCATATVTVTVSPVADTAAADDDAASTTEDTPVTVDVAANDRDADGDLQESSVTVVAGPDHGTTSVNPSTGAVTYTPDADFTGADTFTYSICDASGRCDSATVTVVVSAVADAPAAGADTAAGGEDGAVAVDVLGNDADADGDLDPASVTVVGGPSNGTVAVDPDSGVVTYTPAPDFSGTDSFTYQVCDSSGLCDTATVTVTITAVPDAPVARPDTISTNEDTAVTVNVLSNDSDGDDDLDRSSLRISAEPANGTAVVDADTGTVTYTPDPDFNGTDTFSYEVCDVTGACARTTVTVTVTGLSDQPVANADRARSDGRPVTVNVLANDSDPDGDSLTVRSVSQPGNGTVTLNPDGTVTYTPDAGFTGTDTFTYTVEDPDGNLATAVVTVTVERTDVEGDDDDREPFGPSDPGDPVQPAPPSPPAQPDTPVAPDTDELPITTNDPTPSDPAVGPGGDTRVPTTPRPPVTGAPSGALATLGAWLVLVGLALNGASRRRGRARAA